MPWLGQSWKTYEYLNKVSSLSSCTCLTNHVPGSMLTVTSYMCYFLSWHPGFCCDISSWAKCHPSLSLIITMSSKCGSLQKAACSGVIDENLLPMNGSPCLSISYAFRRKCLSIIHLHRRRTIFQLCTDDTFAGGSPGHSGVTREMGPKKCQIYILEWTKI